MTVRVATYVRAGQLTRRTATKELDRRRDRLLATVAHWPGCVIVASYADAGDPRSTHRPGLAALLADTAAQRFDVVVVESLDQLAGDPATLRAVLWQLGAIGVWVPPTYSHRRARAAGWAAVAMLELLGD